MTVAFVDTETTGLDLDRHQIWEVGIVMPDGWEQRWFLPVDLGRADPFALDIGKFHDRHPDGYQYKRGPGDDDQYIAELRSFAREFAELTYGWHIAGAVISFDDYRLARLLRAHGEQPAWHYHTIDVEALAIGYLAAKGTVLTPPWKSDQLTEALGITVPLEDKHTALGDARWAKAIYDVIMK